MREIVSIIGLVKNRWFRWIAWAVLLAAAIIPFCSSFLYNVVVYGSWPEYWYWDVGLFFTVPLLVITIVAWFSPIVGGALAVIAGLLGLLIGLNYASINDTFILIVYGPFLIGGMLCNIWGWLERRREYGQG